MLSIPMAPTQEEDVRTEISSTASPEENKKAFFKKLQSRKYKFILHVLIAAFSFLSLIWVAILTRAALSFLDHIEIDFRKMNKRIGRMISKSINLMTARSGIEPRILPADEMWSKVANATVVGLNEEEQEGFEVLSSAIND